jgi:hypothetical protein
MTLIVSLRTLDGIVIAGDSLATMMGTMAIQADISATCPQCNHPFTTQATLPNIPMPSTTLSYAQKVFPFLDKFGVGTFGIGQLVGKTIYYAMRELEKDMEKRPLTQRPGNVTDAAKKIGDYALKLLKGQVQREGQDINTMPDKWNPLGFQVVGYNGDKAATVEVHVGKTVSIGEHTDPGFTATGQTHVVQALGTLYQADPMQQPMGDVFSLQDAISYAEFLISTTAMHQRFSRTPAGVGGEIDIALVTPFDNFKWIRQKTLQSKISGDM